MVRWHWLLGLLALVPLVPQASGLDLLGRFRLQRVNMKLHGQLLDFTANHGSDNRLWSPSLRQKRDMYVYLPPCYSPARKYPLAIFLHGATQDEQLFRDHVVSLFDRSIACGDLPPVIIAAPDGSILGRPSFYHSASWWANSRAGNFEDYVMHDVWDFMMENFPIVPEREGHALLGVSMGGSAAFAHGMNHKDRVKIVVGFLPALNLRWVDCHGRYQGKFDPNCWGWREQAHCLEVIGRPAWGLVKMRFSTLFGPTVGRCGPQAVEELSRINPAEIMERVNLQDKELDMYVAYGGRDEFNMDAQVESFLCLAKQRGVSVAVDYNPQGRHNIATGVEHFAAAIRWVAPIVGRFQQN